MADYAKMYSILFNALSEINLVLQRAQQETEEIYMSSEEYLVSIIPDCHESKQEERIKP